MMDGHTIRHGALQSVAFVSKLQADHYGGYAGVARALAVDVILPPTMIEEFYGDLGDGYAEVGHA